MDVSTYYVERSSLIVMIYMWLVCDFVEHKQTQWSKFHSSKSHQSCIKLHCKVTSEIALFWSRTSGNRLSRLRLRSCEKTATWLRRKPVLLAYVTSFSFSQWMQQFWVVTTEPVPYSTSTAWCVPSFPNPLWDLSLTQEIISPNLPAPPPLDTSHSLYLCSVTLLAS